LKASDAEDVEAGAGDAYLLQFMYVDPLVNPIDRESTEVVADAADHDLAGVEPMRVAKSRPC
jgi:hypothetical protein